MFQTLLVMTVEPGFGGQSFMNEMMSKVCKARQRYPELIVQVDGGLNMETTPIAVQNGANAIVAGGWPRSQQLTPTHTSPSPCHIEDVSSLMVLISPMILSCSFI